MAWQTSTINPATTSPAQDISKIVNDLSVLKGVIGGTPDAAVPSTWTSALAALQQAFNSGTTGGTSTAYTLTPSTSIPAYTAGMTFWVTFHAACGASPTLQISGVASPPNLVRQLGDGSYANVSANDIPANHRSRVTLISATQALVEDMPAPAAASIKPSMMANGGAEFGMVNRLINPNMEIDQRNNGASITPVDGSFPVDRWRCGLTAASKFTAQQVTAAPAGYKNSLKATSSSAYTVGSTDEFEFIQNIEGANIVDLAWGTASAKPVTLSFWVQSSLTGTFGGSIINSDGSRCYPFSYTVNAANTWEQKVINIAGDTAGTWLTTNGKGISIFFSLGAGASVVGTAGAWGSTFYRGVTGQVNLVANNAATFNLTGVDFRKGTYTSAPSADWRPYGVEDALCKRYYQVRSGTQISATRAFQSDVAVRMNVPLIAPMRAAPTVSLTGSTGFSAGPSASPISDYVFVSGNSSVEAYITGYTATAEL